MLIPSLEWRTALTPWEMPRCSRLSTAPRGTGKCPYVRKTKRRRRSQRTVVYTTGYQCLPAWRTRLQPFSVRQMLYSRAWSGRYAVVLRQRRCSRGCGRWCSEAGWSVVCRPCGVPLLRVSACGARVRVSSSDCPVLPAERVNPDWVVSCIGGNHLHRRYLAARDRVN